MGVVYFNSSHTQIPPVRVERHWYQLDDDYLQKIADQMSKLTSHENILSRQKHSDRPSTKAASLKNPSNHSTPNSDFETQFGLHGDPLYSRHQHSPPSSGLDPSDNNFVFVDAHVLTTPTLADTDGDGLQNELVVPVSYYFDPYLYGDKKLVQSNLGGLEQSELENYVLGGVVVLDLATQTIVQQKVLGITRANSDQPAYQLATPTVVKMAQGDSDSVIIVGSTTGSLHVLRANDLSSVNGFPLSLDSISSQVAVADLFGTGVLNIVVGDHSGNVYCIDREGKRVWEQEVNVAVIASVRFADLDTDGKLEVILATEGGDLWVLNGQDGTPYPTSYPLHLNAAQQSSVLVMHLNSSHRGALSDRKRLNALSVVMSTSDALYVIDALTGCVASHESSHMFMDVLADDIDPYSPGPELLAISLDGHLVCFSTHTAHWTDLDYAVEAWPGASIGQNGFTHKSSSFALVLPHANDTVRTISGGSFNLDIQIYHSPGHALTNTYRVQVLIGRKHILYNDVVTVDNKVNDVRLVLQSPPSPLHCFVTVKVCNAHAQCDTQSYNVRFNMNFEDNLKWLLSFPFLFMCVLVLWMYREAGVDSLPTTTGRKNL